MHVIAAKAVCFLEAAKPEFRDYARAIVANAHALAETLTAKGYHIISGGTDNHLMLIDLRPTLPDLTGKKAQITLDAANVTTNKNAVPNETRSPFQASGIRLGTPAVTTRGMGVEEMKVIGDIIDKVLRNVDSAEVIESQKTRVLELTARFPLPY